jgi:hypothetical protein
VHNIAVTQLHHHCDHIAFTLLLSRIASLSCALTSVTAASSRSNHPHITIMLSCCRHAVCMHYHRHVTVVLLRRHHDRLQSHCRHDSHVHVIAIVCVVAIACLKLSHRCITGSFFDINFSTCLDAFAEKARKMNF